MGSETMRVFLEGKSDTPHTLRVRASRFDQAWRTACELTEVAPPPKPRIEKAAEKVWLEPFSRTKVEPGGTGAMYRRWQAIVGARSVRMPPVHMVGLSE